MQNSKLVAARGGSSHLWPSTKMWENEEDSQGFLTVFQKQEILHFLTKACTRKNPLKILTVFGKAVEDGQNCSGRLPLSNWSWSTSQERWNAWAGAIPRGRTSWVWWLRTHWSWSRQWGPVRWDWPATVRRRPSAETGRRTDPDEVDADILRPSYKTPVNNSASVTAQREICKLPIAFPFLQRAAMLALQALY